MIALHSFEHDCPLCEALHVGVFAYRATAEELGSDDPAVIDPIWRARCQARVDAIALLSRALPAVNRHAAA